VLGQDLGPAGNRQLVPPNLLELPLTGSHDDQLLALDPAPDLLAHPARRHRGAHRAVADDLVVLHCPGLAQRRRVRLPGQRVEAGCSSASISTGSRLVAECGFPLTSSQKRSQAATNWAKLVYSSSRFAWVPDG
jgi:hypothetical protein